MKRIHLVLSALLGFALTSTAGLISSMDNIDFWVGSGSNSAVMVIDFSDGESTDSFAWGYNWDGTASGADMILAIASADINLTLDSSGDGSDSFLLSSISYLSYTQTTASDWSTYWGYYIAGGYASDTIEYNGAIETPLAVLGGGDDLPDSWTESPVGASEASFGDSGRILSDGSWDAWTYGAWGTTPGATVEAVPEPASALLMLIGAVGVYQLRRCRKKDD